MRRRHTAYRRFLVVTRARTGSNLLISALDSHPNVHAEGELLQQVAPDDIDAVLARIYFAPRPRAIGASGFKIFYYHPLGDETGVVWDKLRAVEGLHVVHLNRRNRLRTFTSRRIADQTRVWIDKKRGNEGTDAREPLTLRRRELQKAFEQGVAFETECEQRFAGWPMIEMYYEDLVTDLAAAMRPLTMFLGVPDAPVRPQTKQQNPEPLSTLIANYDELARDFADTPWAAFFDG
jgi:LPS sulfotransferase NodH